MNFQKISFVAVALVLCSYGDLQASQKTSSNTQENQLAPKAQEDFLRFQTEAKKGESDAQYNLALSYQNGRVVAQNDKEAFHWFKKAAEQGHIDAQFNVGLCYEKGLGVKQNRKEAALWFKKSADQEKATPLLPRLIPPFLSSISN